MKTYLPEYNKLYEEAMVRQAWRQDRLHEWLRDWRQAGPHDRRQDGAHDWHHARLLVGLQACLQGGNRFNREKMAHQSHLPLK